MRCRTLRPHIAKMRTSLYHACMPTEQIPVSLFWYQEDQPPEVQACLASWSEDHRFTGEVFSAQGAEQFFVQRGMTRELAAFRKCGPYAMASDFFRLHLLLERGGFYVDANWAQKTPIAPFLDTLVTRGKTGLIAEITELYKGQPDPLSQYFIAQGGEMLINGVLFVREPRDPFLELCAEVCLRNIEQGKCEQIAFATGSGIMAVLLLLRVFDARADYVAKLDAMATRLFHGKDVSASIQNVIYATESKDHSALQRHFTGIETVPAESLHVYAAREGLGQAHKDHWTQHKGSLYRTSA